MSEASAARRGLDACLAAHPELDLVRVDWQLGDDARMPGPWLRVWLGDPVFGDELSPVWASLTELAVWKSTGDAYRIGRDGAVEEDPFWRAA